MVHTEHAQSLVCPAQQKRHPAAIGRIFTNSNTPDEGGKGGQTGGEGRPTEGTNRRRESETGQTNNPETADSSEGVPVQLAKVRLGGYYQDQTLSLNKTSCSMCCSPVYVRVP